MRIRSDAPFAGNARRKEAGNSINGIAIIDPGGNHIIAGNRIGTDVTGTVELPNRSYGVSVANASNIIGTNGDGIADDVEGNLISGNNAGSLLIEKAGAINNVVAYINSLAQ